MRGIRGLSQQSKDNRINKLDLSVLVLSFQRFLPLWNHPSTKTSLVRYCRFLFVTREQGLPHQEDLAVWHSGKCILSQLWHWHKPRLDGCHRDSNNSHHREDIDYRRKTSTTAFGKMRNLLTCEGSEQFLVMHKMNFNLVSFMAFSKKKLQINQNSFQNQFGRIVFKN